MMKLAAGIVLYNPDLKRLTENINSVKPQVDKLILVDNGSMNFELIKKEYEKDKTIVIIKNEKNIGVAAALNQIVKYCDSQRYEWVLTLDQDSIIPLNLIENYLKFISIDKVAILTPKVVDRNDTKHDSININQPEYEFVEKCITSASFVNVKICIELGCFDEIMFIDLVDFEYCVRVIKGKYKIIRLNNLVLDHQLGDMKVIKIFGKKIYITNHSGNRLYYYSRNSIYYQKKHCDFIKKHTIYFNIIKKIVKIIAFETGKFNKIKSIFVGIIDGNKMSVKY